MRRLLDCVVAGFVGGITAMLLDRREKPADRLERIIVHNLTNGQARTIRGARRAAAFRAARQ
jgi:hypothetical protein